MNTSTAEPPIDVDAVTYKKLTGWKEIACSLSELPGGHHGYYQPEGAHGGHYVCYVCKLRTTGETLARICRRIGEGHALLFPELVELTPRQTAKVAERIVQGLDDEDALNELEDMGG